MIWSDCRSLFLWSWSESDRKFQITIFPTSREKFVEIWKNSQWFFANFRFFLKIASEKNITKGISMESVFSKFFKNFICDSDPCIQKIEWSDDRVIWDHDLIGDHFFVMLQIVILIWSKITFWASDLDLIADHF